MLEAGDTTVLVEGRKPADTPAPAAAPAPVLIRLPASAVGGTGEEGGEDRAEGPGVKEEAEAASAIKAESMGGGVAMDTSADGGAAQAVRTR